MSLSPARTRDAAPGILVGAVLLGVALCAPTWGRYVSAGHYLQAGSIAAFLLPLSVVLFRVRPQPDVLAGLFLVIGAFLLPLVVSVLLHLQDYDYVARMVAGVRLVAMTLYILTIGFVLQHPRGDELLHRAFGIMAILLGAFFVFSAVTSPVWAWDRLKPGDMHPNWWGEVFVATVFGASFLRSALLRYGLWGLAIVGLVLVQSRGSLLSSLVIIAFAMIVTDGPKRLIRFSLIGLFVGLPLLLIVDGVMASRPLVVVAYEFVVSDVLKLDDPTRGLDSGFSGRDDDWLRAFRLIGEHPVIGAGFSRTDIMTGEEFGTPIHNGHLTLVSDLGLPLSLLLFGLMFGALYRTIRQRWWRETGYLVAFLFVYMMLSPRGINVSVLPMLLWMLVTYAWVRPLVRPANADAAMPPISEDAPRRRLGDRWHAAETNRPTDTALVQQRQRQRQGAFLAP